MIVRKDAVDVVFGVIENFIKASHGVAGEADGADFSGFLGLDQGGDRFLPNLVQFYKLYIMEED